MDFQTASQLFCALQFTEVRFASLLSSGFTTMAVINPSKKNWQIAPLCSVSEELKTVSITVPPLRHAYTKHARINPFILPV